MLFLLVRYFLPWLEAHELGFLRVFTRFDFRGTVAIIVSFLTCILLGPRVIAWLKRMRIGDNANFDQADINTALAPGKQGTPTMGGLLIVGAIASSTLLLGDLSNFYVTMALVSLLWSAAVGIADDWLKLTAGRRAGSRQGLKSIEKLFFQIGLGLVLAIFTYRHGAAFEETHTLYFPILKGVKIVLPAVCFVLLSTLVLTGTTNAVNLTDGLDGLATGCMGIVSFTFFLLAIIIGTGPLANLLLFTHIPPAGEMAVLAGAISGACLGFLWFNCHPASVFMGDTGSLAIGSLMAYIAIVTRLELTLLLVGGVFVVEALSVLIQVSYFKYTRRRHGEGRRIFLCSPLHLHFIKKGWKETQVVVRFWLIGAMLAAMALATLRLR